MRFNNERKDFKYKNKTVVKQLTLYPVRIATGPSAAESTRHYITCAYIAEIGGSATLLLCQDSYKTQSIHSTALIVLQDTHCGSHRDGDSFLRFLVALK